MSFNNAVPLSVTKDYDVTPYATLEGRYVKTVCFYSFFLYEDYSFTLSNYIIKCKSMVEKYEHISANMKYEYNHQDWIRILSIMH